MGDAAMTTTNEVHPFVSWTIGSVCERAMSTAVVSWS